MGVTEDVVGALAWIKMFITGKEPAPTPPRPEQRIADELASISRMRGRGNSAPAELPMKSLGRSFRATEVPIALKGLQDGECGGLATFSYIDANGLQSNRIVRDWYSEGRYIKGRCTTQGGARNFRKDRISGWLAH